MNDMNDKDLWVKLENYVNFLATHNKNYTKEQYYKILDIQEILEIFRKRGGLFI